MITDIADEIEKGQTMNARDFAVFILGSITLLHLSGCTDAHKPDRTEHAAPQLSPLVVYVSNYPLKYFADQIGGEHVAVRFPLPADVDPAYWKPDPEKISEYQHSDLILFIGAGYERWARTASLPRSKLCVTSDGFVSDLITTKDSLTHSHGPEGEHSHRELAFTVWIDPILAIKQAEAIRDSLLKLRPMHAERFRDNFEKLKGKLEELDRNIATLISQSPRRPVVFSHPVYQYLEKRYAINAISVHWEPDEVPSDRMWTDFEERLKTHPAQWMIWEGKPSVETVEKLKKRGVTSIVFSPCANDSENRDYLEVQNENVRALSKVYSE